MSQSANKTSHAAAANQYARGVAAGKILACKWVKLACRRHLNDLAKAKSKEYPFVFDAAKANDVCDFIEGLPHTKGDWAARAETIRLEPWQCFVLCCVFGWLKRANGLRRFQLVYLCVARKNGKSILAGGIGNYMFAADGEFGAEVYSGATTEKQAWEVFRPARQMVERTPEMKEAFGIHVGAKTMAILANGSRFEPVIGKPGDGASPSCGIVDEYHEHETDDLFDTLRTGMGARKQPLMLVITTAGSNIAGPCHALQADVQKVLDGSIERDELFGIVYTCDAEEDWTTEEALRKANPNYGISVSAEFLKTEQQNAVRDNRKQNVFKTKHLNIWVTAKTAWMNMQKWSALADPSLDAMEFIGDPCFAAVDLASKMDIAARVKVFRRKQNGADHFYAFGSYCLPEERALLPELQHYQKWVHDGHLLTTAGNVLDYEKVTADTIREIAQYRIGELGFDPWNAEQFAQTIARETQTQIVEFPQQVKFMSEPMKQLEAVVYDGRLHHDGNPVLNWMMSNVVAKEDIKGNIYPNKERPESKIDGAVALIMAFGRALVNTQQIEAGIY